MSRASRPVVKKNTIRYNIFSLKRIPVSTIFSFPVILKIHARLHMASSLTKSVVWKIATEYRVNLNFLHILIFIFNAVH